MLGSLDFTTNQYLNRVMFHFNIGCRHIDTVSLRIYNFIHLFNFPFIHSLIHISDAQDVTYIILCDSHKVMKAVLSLESVDASNLVVRHLNTSPLHNSSPTTNIIT